MTKYALCTTTINIPINLEAYAQDIGENDLAKDTIIVVAGDVKTPSGTEEFCESLQTKYGVRTLYLTPEDQANGYPEYSSFLGWNTIQRRNIAFLAAYHAGAEILVTIDDDNFLIDKGYLRRHGEIGETVIRETVESTSGWYNNCLRLSCLNTVTEFYPRGYSMRDRGVVHADRWIKGSLLARRIMVNAGLWMGDPDIDAVTRLAINPKVDNAITSPVALAKGTYCPFNSQNTAFHRDILPAYCMTSRTGRFDDIIPSFFVKRIADHLDHAITFGDPVVKQTRNDHNLWKDLDGEIVGMQLTDPIVDWLRTVELKGKNYAECIDEIMDAFIDRWRADSSLKAPEQTSFINSIITSYGFWKEVL